MQSLVPERHASVTWRIVVAMCGLAACTPIPPRTYPVPEPVTIEASFGRTWDAVIDHFAVGSIPIQTIERVSGLIVTRPLRIPGTREQAQVYADCGTDMLGTTGWPTESSYNIRVTGDSTRSSIRVTAIFAGVSALDVCNSKGMLEQNLITAIVTKVQARR